MSRDGFSFPTKVNRTHPSRHVIFFGQHSAQKKPTALTSHDVLESLKQALFDYSYMISLLLNFKCNDVEKNASISKPVFWGNPWFAPRIPVVFVISAGPKSQRSLKNSFSGSAKKVAERVQDL